MAKKTRKRIESVDISELLHKSDVQQRAEIKDDFEGIFGDYERRKRVREECEELLEEDPDACEEKIPTIDEYLQEREDMGFKSVLIPPREFHVHFPEGFFWEMRDKMKKRGLWAEAMAVSIYGDEYNRLLKIARAWKDKKGSKKINLC